VEPKGSWGRGRIELVQIPVPDETNDNIVAYWVPDRQPKPREAFTFGYRMLWQKDREMRPQSGWVRETRRGRGYTKAEDGSVELHVDFEGPTLARIPATTAVDAVVSIDGNGEILERHTVRNDVTGGRRLVMRVRRLDRGKPLELRAHLKHGHEIVSETWSYIVPAE
jgi:glucans biosynthesis protein